MNCHPMTVTEDVFARTTQRGILPQHTRFFYWCQFVDLQQAHAAIQAQPPRQNHKCKTTVAKLHPEFSNKQ